MVSRPPETEEETAGPRLVGFTAVSQKLGRQWWCSSCILRRQIGCCVSVSGAQPRLQLLGLSEDHDEPESLALSTLNQPLILFGGVTTQRNRATVGTSVIRIPRLSIRMPLHFVGALVGVCTNTGCLASNICYTCCACCARPALLHLLKLDGKSHPDPLFRGRTTKHLVNELLPPDRPVSASPLLPIGLAGRPPSATAKIMRAQQSSRSRQRQTREISCPTRQPNGRVKRKKQTERFLGGPALRSRRCAHAQQVPAVVRVPGNPEP